MVVFLAALSLVAGVQDDGKFGKTDAQILAMGRKAWVAFAAEEKMGGSTMGYVTAESVYGDALGARNDAQAGKRAPAIKALRKYLNDFTNDFIAIGTGITGGGTMWNMIAASRSTDVEELLAFAIRPSRMKGASATDAQVLAQFARARRLIETKKKSLDENRTFSHVGYRDALQYLFGAQSTYKARLRPALAKLSPAAAGRVRAFCRDLAMLRDTDES